MLVGAEEIKRSEPVSKDSHSSSKGKPGNLYRFFGAWEGDEYADMKEKILEAGVVSPNGLGRIKEYVVEIA